MRIAQVAPLYERVPPKLYGGTERVVSYLTEELVRQGHEVTLFASGDSITRAKLVPVCPRSLRLSNGVSDYLAHHLFMLEQVCSAKDDFDIVHFHIDYLHFPLSRREQLVNLTTLHGRLDIPDLVPLYSVFRDMPFVSISDAQRQPLPWINWQATVYHGMPEDQLMPGRGTGQYLAFLGRISPEKGLDEAIEIATKVGIPLRIAAKVDRVDREYFETTIRPRLNHPLVEFLGEIGYAEKNSFLGDAMALLFPVNWPEPFGMVMIEAMACGTPVIAYPYGSVPEIIQDGINGFLTRNREEAVAAVTRVPTLSRNRCRQHFEERFTAGRMTEDYLALYERLVDGESQPLMRTEGSARWLT
jgi:glycosyltransferase involved in cell wall biosynthesis